MAKLILISGKAESGKTLTANIIKERLENRVKKVTILPFASYLKFICREHFGWDGKKNEEGRRILQHVGTDIVRERNPNFWVKTVVDFVDTFGQDFDFIISDDVRFPNEIMYFADIGNIDFLTIRVSRLEYENSLTDEQRQHSSEVSLDSFAFDAFLSSFTGEENVRESVRRLFEDYATWLSG